MTNEVAQSLDFYHEEGCEIFIGQAGNGRWVEKPCTCGLDEARAAERRHVDQERLQQAMRQAHGRRISMTETYAEAIARRYNAILDAEADR